MGDERGPRVAPSNPASAGSTDPLPGVLRAPGRPPLSPNPQPIEIILPMPDYRLTLNGRPDWRVRARLVKAYRHLAQVRGRNARIAAGLEKPLTPPVAAAVFFVFRTNRRHDRDNLISGLKAAWDGLKDARLLVDDSIDMFSVVHIGVEVDRKAREAVVRVRLMGGDARSLFLAETLLAEERAHLLASGGRDVDRG